MAKVRTSHFLVALVLIVIGLNVVIDTLVQALPALVILFVLLSLLAFVLGWRGYF